MSAPRSCFVGNLQCREIAIFCPALATFLDHDVADQNTRIKAVVASAAFVALWLRTLRRMERTLQALLVGRSVGGMMEAELDGAAPTDNHAPARGKAEQFSFIVAKCRLGSCAASSRRLTPHGEPVYRNAALPPVLTSFCHSTTSALSTSHASPTRSAVRLATHCTHASFSIISLSVRPSSPIRRRLTIAVSLN